MVSWRKFQSLLQRIRAALAAKWFERHLLQRTSWFEAERTGND
jgi:hypothetical protein